MEKITSREAFRAWLEQNGKTAKECFLEVKRGKPKEGTFSYLDAVEVALCFGWIDSTAKKVNGVVKQRFSPRKKGSCWSELNKERCRRLVRLGEMTEDGLNVCPNLDEEYVFPERVMNALKENEKAYAFFITTPPLYQRIRLYNVDFYYGKDKKTYEAALKNLIEKCEQNKLYGEWNDYGRLL